MLLLLVICCQMMPWPALLPGLAPLVLLLLLLLKLPRAHGSDGQLR